MKYANMSLEFSNTLSVIQYWSRCPWA